MGLAFESGSYRSLHKSSSDGAVHSTTYGTYNESFGTNEIPDAFNFELDEVAHLPVWLRSADIDAEIAQDLASARCLDLNVRGSSGVKTWEDERVQAQGGIGRLATLR